MRGGLKPQTSSFLDRFRFINAKRKIVTFFIVINVLIITVYFTNAKNRSTAILVSTFSPPNSDDLNHRQHKNPDVAGSNLLKDRPRVQNVNTFSSSLNNSRGRQRDSNFNPSVENPGQFADQERAELEKSSQSHSHNHQSSVTTTNTNTNAKHKARKGPKPPPVFQSHHAPVGEGSDTGTSGRRGTPVETERAQDVSFSELSTDQSNENEMEVEGDGSSLRSNAFPNHKIPASLIGWSPSPDSSKYFQPIDTDRGWVFSAYYEPPNPSPDMAAAAAASNSADGIDGGGGQAVTGGGTIRVMITARRNLNGWTYCQFYDHNGVKKAVKKGRRKSMRDSKLTTYGPYCMECPIPSRKMAVRPYYVSLTSDPDTTQPTNYVRVQYPGPPNRNFTVCFSPLHSQFNSTGQLVEAVEFNRVLGADHFFVYNFSISQETDTILRQYQSEGLVTVIQWPLPNLEMWYYGQILAVNDCIYRNKGISKYVVITDTDEIILPHLHRNWSSLISELNAAISPPSSSSSSSSSSSTSSLLEENLSEKVLHSLARHTSKTHPHSPYGGWSFRCAFFADKRLEPHELEEMKKQEFTLEQKKFLVQFPSRRMLSMKRMGTAFDHGSKSKTIVRPECVDAGSIHVVASMKPGYQMAYVKPETALLHHYRDFWNSGQLNTLDTSALRFKDQYLERLMGALVKFPNIFPAVARMHLDFVT